MIDIKRFRTDNNITRREICEVLGVAQPYLSAIERGERPFYDDIMSMGGVKEKLSLIQGRGEHVSEWIGSGDLFPEATAAIREK